MKNVRVISAFLGLTSMIYLTKTAFPGQSTEYRRNLSPRDYVDEVPYSPAGNQSRNGNQVADLLHLLKHRFGTMDLNDGLAQPRRSQTKARHNFRGTTRIKKVQFYCYQISSLLNMTCIIAALINVAV